MSGIRVVKLSLLQMWYEHNVHKTITDKETVDLILDIITKNNVPLSYDTNTVDYVFIRIHQSVKDVVHPVPWCQSGGALTHPNPLTQISKMRYNALKNIEGIKDLTVIYNRPTILLTSDSDCTTLTINTSCEI